MFENIKAKREQKIQEEQEKLNQQIQEERNRLASLSEKELLIEAVIELKKLKYRNISQFPRGRISRISGL